MKRLFPIFISLLLLAFALFAIGRGRADAALTYITNCMGSNTGTVATVNCSSSLNVAAGDLLVAWTEWQDAATGDTVTVDQSDGTDTFTKDTAAVQASDIGGQFAYLLSAPTDAAFTPRMTVNNPSRRVQITVLQFRPDGGSTVTFDGSNTGIGSGTALLSGNISTTGTDEIVLGGGCDADGGTAFSSPTLGGQAATLVAQPVDLYSAAWYKILTGTMTNGNAQATSGNADWVCNIIAFKSAVATSCTAGTPASAVNISVLGNATNFGTTNSLTISAPAGLTSGQLVLISFAAHSAGAPVIVPNANFTNIGANLTSANTSYYFGYGTYNGAANYVFSCNAANFATGVIVGFNFAQMVYPIDANASNTGTSTNCVNVSAVTSTNSNELLAIMAAGYSAANRTFTTANAGGSSMTKVAGTNGSSNRLPMSIWTYQQASKGSSGAMKAFANSTFTSWGGQAVALRIATQTGLSQAQCGTSADAYSYSYTAGGAGNTYNFSVAWGQTSADTYSCTPKFSPSFILTQTSSYSGSSANSIFNIAAALNQTSASAYSPATRMSQSASLSQNSSDSYSPQWKFAGQIYLGQTSDYQESLAYRMGVALALAQTSAYSGSPILTALGSHSLGQTSAYALFPLLSTSGAFGLAQTSAFSESAGFSILFALNLPQVSSYSPIPAWIFSGAFSLPQTSVYSDSSGGAFRGTLALAQTSLYQSGRNLFITGITSLGQTSGYSAGFLGGNFYSVLISLAQSSAYSPIPAWKFAGALTLPQTAIYSDSPGATFLGGITLAQNSSHQGGLTLSRFGTTSLAQVSGYAGVPAWIFARNFSLSQTSGFSDSSRAALVQSIGLPQISSFVDDSAMRMVLTQLFSGSAGYLSAQYTGSIYMVSQVFSGQSGFSLLKGLFFSDSIVMSSVIGANWFGDTWRKAYNAIILLLDLENRTLASRPENRELVRDAESRTLASRPENRELVRDAESRTLVVEKQ